MATRVRDLLRSAGDQLRYEPTARRVRADDVVDSTQAVLVWEPRRIVPGYAVPEADIAGGVTPAAAPPDLATRDVPGMLHPGIPFAVHSAAGTPVDVAGRAGAGFRLDGLAGYVALDTAAFEAWYEEDEQVFGHPRDPFSRIDVRETSRRVRIELDGAVLAETTAARLLFETGIDTRYYVPKADVLGDLVSTDRRTYCPYKGEASYWSLGRHQNIAWSYEHPLPDGPLVAGLVAFWDELVDVFVDDVRVGSPRGAEAAALVEAFGG